MVCFGFNEGKEKGVVCFGFNEREKRVWVRKDSHELTLVGVDAEGLGNMEEDKESCMFR